jgi:V/A-type H+/Na+-transporting ATPase subunit A
VTVHTQRYTRTYWALDRDLANARHYPAVDWKASYSQYAEAVGTWWTKQTGSDWETMRGTAAQILEQDTRLEQLVRLVGVQALPDRQRWILDAARLLKEGFLQQNALHPVDAYCVPAKQAALLRFFVDLYQCVQHMLDAGVPLAQVRQLLDVRWLVQLKEQVPNNRVDQIATAWSDLQARLSAVVPAQRKP